MRQYWGACHRPPCLLAPPQMSAHWFEVEEPAASRTHYDRAVAPPGTSVGHGVQVEHLREQKSQAKYIQTCMY